MEKLSDADLRVLYEEDPDDLCPKERGGQHCKFPDCNCWDAEDSNNYVDLVDQLKQSKIEDGFYEDV
jgi:hypothetical protein